MRRITLAVLSGAMLSAGAIENVSAQDILYSRQPVAYWSGFYIGANVGYGWATGSGTVRDLTAGTSGSASIDINGALGGIQAGYNRQMGTFVLGIETDFQASGQQRNDTLIVGGTILSYTAKQTWFGTTRVRAGAIVGSNSLLYVTGGVTYGDYKLSGNATGAAVGSANFSWTRAGWVLGGGWESIVSNALSVKLEYLYARTDWSDTKVIGANTFTGDLKWSNNIVRLGVNYKISAY